MTHACINIEATCRNTLRWLNEDKDNSRDAVMNRAAHIGRLRMQFGFDLKHGLHDQLEDGMGSDIDQ